VRSLALACVALAGAALIAACGSSSGLIAQSSANTLRTALANVENDFSSHDCGAAGNDLADAQIDFDTLLTGVNQKLAKQLQTGLTTLSADERSQCHSSSSSTGSSGSKTGNTGTTGATSSSSTSSTTSTSTTSTTTTSTSSSSVTGASGATGNSGSTCTSTTVNGGTAVCDGTTSATNGIGGAGIGGGTGTGSPSAGD
jgi:hypothetical protein